MPLHFFILLILLQIFFLDNKDDWHTDSFLIRRTSSKRLLGSGRTGAWNENLNLEVFLSECWGGGGGESEVKVSHVPLFETPWVSQWNSPGQNTGVGTFPFSRESFQPRDHTQVSHIAWILYQLSHKGSPRILEWVAYPFSSRSSRPRIQESNRGLMHCRRILYHGS